MFVVWLVNVTKVHSSFTHLYFLKIPFLEVICCLNHGCPYLAIHIRWWRVVKLVPTAMFHHLIFVLSKVVWCPFSCTGEGKAIPWAEQQHNDYSSPCTVFTIGRKVEGTGGVLVWTHSILSWWESESSPAALFPSARCRHSSHTPYRSAAYMTDVLPKTSPRQMFRCWGGQGNDRRC